MNPTALISTLLLVSAGAVAAAPDETPAQLPPSPLSTTNLIDTGLGLLVVLGLMLGLAWLVKRYIQLPGIGKGQVQILGGVSLGSREKAVLLSVEGKRLLVGVAPGRVQPLMILPDAVVPQPTFAEQLDIAAAAPNLSGNKI
jgi:flagellar protein FliO/FliZ